MYYHPTRKHRATAQRRGALIHTNVRKEAFSDAPPGQWAVAAVNKGLGIGYTFGKAI